MRPLFPSKPAEPSGHRQATRISYILMLATLGTYLIVGLISLYFHDWQTLSAIGGGAVMLALPFWLLKSGRFRAGNLSLTVIVILTVTIIATVGQGIRDLAVVVYPVIFIYVGLTSDRFILGACGGLTFLALLWLAFGESFGWFATKPLFPDPFNLFYLTVLAVLLAITALAVDLLSSNIRSSLQQARGEIEERNRTEAALRGSEAKFRAVVENSYDGILFCDADARIQYRNPSFRLINGYADEERVGQSGFDAVHPQDKNIVRRAWKKMLEEPERSHQAEYRIRHRDGTWRWVETSGVSLLGNPDVQAVVIASRDITKRKQAENALRASEERYRLMFESAPLAINITRGTEIIYANPSYLRLFGFPSFEELRLYPPLELFAPELRSQIMENIQRRVRGLSVPDSYETICAKKDGTRFPVILHMARAVFTDGPAMVAFVVDISERKKAEEEKIKLESQLQQAQKMESVGRLAGGVAHDFNNMLGVIMGRAEMALEHASPSAVVRTDLEEIRRAAGRSAELTRQLLSFARKQTVTPMLLDLGQTVEGMLSMLRRLIGEDIRLEWQPQPSLWRVKMDPSQIDQILANLCVNARDAIADVGTITIEARNCPVDQGVPNVPPGDYVLLTVTDDGSGMDNETLSHLFEPFFTTKALGRGTGLGLATTYGAVKQNNGFINVESRPGRGTSFLIYLQRYAGEPAPPPGPADTASTVRGHETILVVEDEPANLNLVASMLEMQGYTVLRAGTPADAIRLAQATSGEPSLLLTDVIMPEMNGRDLAHKLLSFLPALKVMFMSGYTADVIANKGVLDEGVVFIQKPFSARSLAKKVRKTLGSTR